MTPGILLLNFGEPSNPTKEAVTNYLEQIFLANAAIESPESSESAVERAQSLAARRAPGLIEEYQVIDGSPLELHAQTQASNLEIELINRGHDVQTYVGMQYTPPFINEAVSRAKEDDVDQLIGIPVHPLCGPSTTVESLDQMRQAMSDLQWDVPVHEITGWHRHPRYTSLRADNIRSFVDNRGLTFNDGTKLVFSAHGTPQHYLEEGSRYVTYVEEFCESIARLVGVNSYELGYQNHENRGVEWTKPDIETVISDVSAERIIVEPVSFMHEQSETLFELDVELREAASEVGLDFYRPTIPYDDPQFIAMLADLSEVFISGLDPSYYRLSACECRNKPEAYCLNARLQ